MLSLLFKSSGIQRLAAQEWVYASQCLNTLHTSARLESDKASQHLVGSRFFSDSVQALRSDLAPFNTGSEFAEARANQHPGVIEPSSVKGGSPKTFSMGGRSRQLSSSATSAFKNVEFQPIPVPDYVEDDSKGNFNGLDVEFPCQTGK